MKSLSGHIAREIAADVSHGHIVGIGQDEGPNLPGAQSLMKLNHRRNGCEDVREKTAELVQTAAKSGGGTHLTEELLSADLAGLIAKKQPRVVDVTLDLACANPAARGNFPRGDGIIEIDQNLAEIKNNYGRQIQQN